MIFWTIAIAVTAIACAALLYAAVGRPVNAAIPDLTDPNSHFRQLLAGIEGDVASGKLDEEQAAAAKGELAREMLRARGDKRAEIGQTIGKAPVFAGVVLVAALSFGLYGFLGSPNMPAEPLAERPEATAQQVSLDDAIAQIEARLAKAPDDARGWSVIAPAYVELGRYADAANAYRRVIALSGPTADLKTGLAEALLLGANGEGSDEAMDLLRQAAAADVSAVRPRLYLAAELMRQKSYPDAATAWQQAIDLAKGDEPWLSAARQGLAVAQADGVDTSAAQQTEMIRGMVSGLADRLNTSGGTIEEWTQLVRSYIVLGDTVSAQAAFDKAVLAYPAAFDRGDLDAVALQAGLKLKGDTP